MQLSCLPDWVTKTLQKHANDERPYTYTADELEQARTHDLYWNACQLQMVHAGRMHGYMRMYWGKKVCAIACLLCIFLHTFVLRAQVIEWMKDYETALQWLISMNDKYELDGRDPNGYAGVMWCFGKHDRAHAVSDCSHIPCTFAL